MSKLNIYGLELHRLRALVKEALALPPFRAQQVFSGLYGKTLKSLEEMSTISSDQRTKWLTAFSFAPGGIVEEKRAIDGTIKWLYKVPPSTSAGSAAVSMPPVEMVYIPEFAAAGSGNFADEEDDDDSGSENDTENARRTAGSTHRQTPAACGISLFSSSRGAPQERSYHNSALQASSSSNSKAQTGRVKGQRRARGTLCISSQAGCALRCTFCHTGTQAFGGNLPTEAIVGQVIVAMRRIRELNEGSRETRSSSDEGIESGRRSTTAIPTHDGSRMSNVMGTSATEKSELSKIHGSSSSSSSSSSISVASRDTASIEEVPLPPIDHLVLMGQGEPLLNWSRIAPALRILSDRDGLAFSGRRITVSTSGIAPIMPLIAKEGPRGIRLAISLHAPNDALRTRIMAINKQYPIQALMKACAEHVAASKSRAPDDGDGGAEGPAARGSRGTPAAAAAAAAAATSSRRAPPGEGPFASRRHRVSFEYVMLGGVNDTAALAKELLGLLRAHFRDPKHQTHVNLIPFNAWEGAGYTTSSPAAVEAFQNVLRKGGVPATVRRARGDDILGACGQLRSSLDLKRVGNLAATGAVKGSQ